MPGNVANITIRAAGPGDAEFARELATLVFSAYSRDPRRTIASMLEESRNETLVAEIDFSPAGFVLLHYDQLARDFGSWAKPTAAHLAAIAVSPDACGRGVGRRLLESAEHAARRRPCLSLSLATGERNARARRLFEAHGFVQLARVERYYARGQTAVLMHRTLIG